MPAQSAAGRRWFITILIAMVILAVAAGIALSRSRHASAGDQPKDVPSTATSVAADPVVAESTSPSSSAPTSAAPKTETHNSPPAKKPAAPTGPSISDFHVSQKPSCPAGTNQAPVDGTPVTLTWSTARTGKTTISVDGPGVYDTYGSSDSVTLNFPCGDSSPGSYQSHTYKLTAIGSDGSTRTKTLTVKAKVNEIAQV